MTHASRAHLVIASKFDKRPPAVTRGLDPRVHLLRIDFAKMMDARVNPAHYERVDQIDREPL
jgi:hypothetical protein